MRRRRPKHMNGIKSSWVKEKPSKIEPINVTGIFMIVFSYFKDILHFFHECPTTNSAYYYYQVSGYSKPCVLPKYDTSLFCMIMPRLVPFSNHPKSLKIYSGQ